MSQTCLLTRDHLPVERLELRGHEVLGLVRTEPHDQQDPVDPVHETGLSEASVVVLDHADPVVLREGVQKTGLALERVRVDQGVERDLLDLREATPVRPDALTLSVHELDQDTLLVVDVANESSIAGCVLLDEIIDLEVRHRVRDVRPRRGVLLERGLELVGLEDPEVAVPLDDPVAQESGELLSLEVALAGDLDAGQVGLGAHHLGRDVIDPALAPLGDLFDVLQAHLHRVDHEGDAGVFLEFHRSSF